MRFGLATCLRKVFQTIRLPLKDAIIFEDPSVSDNSYWFFRYLAENTDALSKYKPIWITYNTDHDISSLCGIPVQCIHWESASRKDLLKTLYYRNSARFIIDCNRFVYKYQPKQVRIHLTHGMPIKNAVGYNAERGEVDHEILTSDVFASFLKLSTDSDQTMLSIGLPRNDILASNRGNRQNADKKAVIWMPTFRKSSFVEELRMDNRKLFSFPLLDSEADLHMIDDALTKLDMVLYLRLHPAEDISNIRFSDYKSIIICDNAYLKKIEMTLHEFLAFKTDALITDYSSIYFDYLLTDRPIALCWNDIDDYRKIWPLIFDDMDAHFHCMKLKTLQDLITFCKNVQQGKDGYQKGRITDRSAYCECADDKSCERLYRVLKDTYGFDQ